MPCRLVGNNVKIRDGTSDTANIVKMLTPFGVLGGDGTLVFFFRCDKCLETFEIFSFKLSTAYI